MPLAQNMDFINTIGGRKIHFQCGITDGNIVRKDPKKPDKIISSKPGWAVTLAIWVDDKDNQGNFIIYKTPDIGVESALQRAFIEIAMEIMDIVDPLPEQPKSNLILPKGMN